MHPFEVPLLQDEMLPFAVSTRKICHNITAKSRYHEFSIDFVPAIKILVDGFEWQSVPKEAPGPKLSNACTFMMICVCFNSELNYKEVINQTVLLQLVKIRSMRIKDKLIFFNVIATISIHVSDGSHWAHNVHIFARCQLVVFDLLLLK